MEQNSVAACSADPGSEDCAAVALDVLPVRAVDYSRQEDSQRSEVESSAGMQPPK